MNIKYLQKFLSRMNEIKIISKNAEINGVVCNVAGVVRYGYSGDCIGKYSKYKKQGKLSLHYERQKIINANNSQQYYYYAALEQYYKSLAIYYKGFFSATEL